MRSVTGVFKAVEKKMGAQGNKVLRAVEFQEHVYYFQIFKFVFFSIILKNF